MWIQLAASSMANGDPCSSRQMSVKARPLKSVKTYAVVASVEGRDHPGSHEEVRAGCRHPSQQTSRSNRRCRGPLTRETVDPLVRATLLIKCRSRSS